MYGPQDHGTWRNTARHEETFNDVLYAQLKKTPWWLISIGVHGILVAILFMMPWQTGGMGGAQQITSKLDDNPIEKLDDITPEIDPPKPIEQEKVVPDPVVKDVKVSDHVETDNDQPFEESLGQEDFISDAPFRGPSTNAAIGIGGGAGGSFGGRGGNRDLTALGGSGKTERVVDLGLEWLKNHQDPEGFWDCDGFQSQCVINNCDGQGGALYDPGVTGLALLAFLGAGNTHKTGDYQETVKTGLQYLRLVQDPEGCFGPRTSQHFTYNHAIAALAMAEAYGMTQTPVLKPYAQKGIDFVLACQNPYLAWRYGVRPGDNDTSVSGWMIMALKSAKASGLAVDEAGFEGMKAWIDKATEPDYGKVGYTGRGGGSARPQDLADKFPSDKTESLTAVGILSRIFIGEDPKSSEMIQKGTDLCLKALPVWDPQSGAIDMYYWYYGTLAIFQVGGKPWDEWNKAIQAAIIDTQRKDGDEKGSWDPIDPWGRDGGRVYSTSVLVMCMEVYYRYDRVFGATSR